MMPGSSSCSQSLSSPAAMPLASTLSSWPGFTNTQLWPTSSFGLVMLLNLSLILAPAGASNVSISYLNSSAPAAVPISIDTEPDAVAWVGLTPGLVAVGCVASDAALVAAGGGW